MFTTPLDLTTNSRGRSRLGTGSNARETDGRHYVDPDNAQSLTNKPGQRILAADDLPLALPHLGRDRRSGMTPPRCAAAGRGCDPFNRNRAQWEFDGRCVAQYPLRGDGHNGRSEDHDSPDPPPSWSGIRRRARLRETWRLVSAGGNSRSLFDRLPSYAICDYRDQETTARHSKCPMRDWIRSHLSSTNRRNKRPHFLGNLLRPNSASWGRNWFQVRTVRQVAWWRMATNTWLR